MKTYRIKMNERHRNLIIESLSIYKAVFTFDFHTIINFIKKEAPKEWISNDNAFTQCLPLRINNVVEAFCKNLDNSRHILKADNILGKINQEIFSEDEVQAIIGALDLSSRITCGQINEIGSVLRFSTAKMIDRDDLEHAMNALKVRIFPKIGLHASYGIYGEKTPLNPRICYEMIQVLRHELWKNSESKLDYIVSAYPVHHETGFELIEIELIEQAALDNPDLPEEFVLDSLKGLKEAEGGLTEDYDF